MTSVLQNWLENIPIRMQSTLLLSLRGPDTHQCVEIKRVQRWMRGLVFKPGNPANAREFMASIDDVPILYERGPFAKELEFCSKHFYGHFLHGIEVLAYKHPDIVVRDKAYQLFFGMCDYLHLPVESVESFNIRLCTIEWDGGQPDSFENIK